MCFIDRGVGGFRRKTSALLPRVVANDAAVTLSLHSFRPIGFSCPGHADQTQAHLRKLVGINLRMLNVWKDKNQPEMEK